MEALRPMLDSGSIILGGCDISSTSAAFHCRLCHHEWGIAPEAIDAEQRYIQAMLDRQVALKLADRRGIRVATTNKNGYCKCPHCGRSFSTRHEMSWDGIRHTSCLGRVELLPYRPTVSEAT